MPNGLHTSSYEISYVFQSEQDVENPLLCVRVPLHRSSVVFMAVSSLYYSAMRHPTFSYSARQPRHSLEIHCVMLT